MNKELLKAELIKGFNKLSKTDQDMFKGFLKNFYAAFEHPEDHAITKVSVAHERRGRQVVEFVKAKCASGEWFHVMSSQLWY